MSYSTTNRNVLAVNENGIKILNTPNYNAEDSVEKLDAVMVLNKEGASVLNGQFKYTGYQCDITNGAINMTEENRKNAFKSIYNGLNIEDLTIKEFTNDRSESSLSYALDIKVKNYISEMDTDLIIRAIPFPKSTLTKVEDQ